MAVTCHHCLRPGFFSQVKQELTYLRTDEVHEDDKRHIIKRYICPQCERKYTSTETSTVYKFTDPGSGTWPF